MASFIKTTFDNLVYTISKNYTRQRQQQQQQQQGRSPQPQQYRGVRSSSRHNTNNSTGPSRPTTTTTGPTETPTNQSCNSNNSRNTNTTTSHTTNTTTTNANTTTPATNMNNSSIPKAQEKLDIGDIKDPGDISILSAKQLKIILTRNCIDYKGVFEKEVLREKVLQLWIDCNEERERRRAHNIQAQGGSQNGDLDDIDDSQACKICMERPVNCVLLECGHMLSCVTCGRKLAECPICRQNITRCVRTFRG